MRCGCFMILQLHADRYAYFLLLSIWSLKLLQFFTRDKSKVFAIDQRIGIYSQKLRQYVLVLQPTSITAQDALFLMYLFLYVFPLKSTGVFTMSNNSEEWSYEIFDERVAEVLDSHGQSLMDKRSHPWMPPTGNGPLRRLPTTDRYMGSVAWPLIKLTHGSQWIYYIGQYLITIVCRRSTMAQYFIQSCH